MKNFIPISLLACGLAIAFSCSLWGPKRQRVKEVRRQSIPTEIINTYWTLESIDNEKPDCEIIIGLLDKGQLILKFKGELYDGDYLWYIVKDSVIDFHTTPLEKFAWTSDNCEMNPPSFASYIDGTRQFSIQDGKLTFMTFDNKELRFAKM